MTTVALPWPPPRAKPVKVGRIDGPCPLAFPAGRDPALLDAAAHGPGGAAQPLGSVVNKDGAGRRLRREIFHKSSGIQW